MRAAAQRHDGLVRWAGAALAAGGVHTALINAFLTPAVATGQPFAVTAATPVFLWRQAASALAAALLLFGSVGLHLGRGRRQRHPGRGVAVARARSAPAGAGRGGMTHPRPRGAGRATASRIAR